MSETTHEPYRLAEAALEAVASGSTAFEMDVLAQNALALVSALRAENERLREENEAFKNAMRAHQLTGDAAYLRRHLAELSAVLGPHGERWIQDAATLTARAETAERERDEARAANAKWCDEGMRLRAARDEARRQVVFLKHGPASDDLTEVEIATHYRSIRELLPPYHPAEASDG